MWKSKSLVAVTFAAMLAISGQGLAQTQPDPHHPQQGQVMTPAMPGAQEQSGMMPMMMSMMGQMMQMMGGGQMGMDGMGMPEMGMANHIEGRIAFLRAELKITAAQAKAWDTFANALRDNAKRLKELGGSAMAGMAKTDLPAQLQSEETLLGARLEVIHRTKAALEPLYAVLTDDQRKTADELLVTHLSFMPAGMMQGGTAMGGMTPMQQ